MRGRAEACTPKRKNPAPVTALDFFWDGKNEQGVPEEELQDSKSTIPI
jgi:hypothetical protein